MSSATAANRGVPPARAMTIAPKTKPTATGQILADGTKREASNRSSSESSGGEKGNCTQIAKGVHDEAGGGGAGIGEEGVKQYPGLVSLRGMNFRWSSAGEEDEYAKAFGELAEKGKGKGAVAVGGNDDQASG